MAKEKQVFGAPKAPFTFDSAMRRLAYLMAFGGLVIAAYGASIGRDCLSAICLGLMIALAAALGAGLLGFIFGVPFARDSNGAPAKEVGVGDRGGTEGSAPTYRANTSLEQISDWLTKILVGVGLVEIQAAPHALHSLVAYLAPGIGPGRQAEAFVTSVLVFFAVTGFLFGFLWARLYLRRWLTDADRDFIEKLSRFDSDAKAFSLVAQQLQRREDESPVPQEDLAEAIKRASSTAKSWIFDLAKAASESWEDKEYTAIKNPAAASILLALIASDTNATSHRYHGELGLTLGRQRPPDFPGANAALTEAISRRDRLGPGGWFYYEFRRALNRIKLDANFRDRKVSDAAEKAANEADLRAAKASPENFDRWRRDNKEVDAWLDLNNVKF